MRIFCAAAGFFRGLFIHFLIQIINGISVPCSVNSESYKSDDCENNDTNDYISHNSAS